MDDYEYSEEEFEQFEQTEVQENIEEPETDTQVEQTEAITDDNDSIVIDEDALSYRDYIAMLYDAFLDMHKGQADLENAWNEVRSQVNSCLKLGIQRKYIKTLISLDFSYEMREILKLFYFSGAEERVINKITPSTSIKEALSYYDASRVEGTVSNMLDTPLNAMSRMIDTYKEDLEQFKANIDVKLADTQAELDETKEKLANAEAELKRYREAEEQERLRKEQEKFIEEETEKRVKERVRQEVEKINQVQKQQQLIYKINGYAEQINRNANEPSNKQIKKKRGLFGKKKETEIEQVEYVQAPVISIMNDMPLPSDFDLSEYLMKANLSTSQMDIIALASKCDVPDHVIKNMIDSNKDARQLKQILEVFLAKREKEKQDAMKKGNSTIEEDEIYYD